VPLCQKFPRHPAARLILGSGRKQLQRSLARARCFDVRGQGVTSEGGKLASICDLRSAAFSTSAAATFGSVVDWANLRRVAA
jgi:hypothetical protein